MTYLRNSFLTAVGVVVIAGLVSKIGGNNQLTAFVYQVVYLVGGALSLTGLGSAVWFLFQNANRERVYDGLALIALGGAVMTQSASWATLSLAILVVAELRPLIKKYADKG